MSTMSSEIMLDLETRSVRPHASILTIGAIRFQRRGELQPYNKMDRFYRRIILDSDKSYNLHVDPETMNWWNTQSEDAKYEAIKNPDRVNIRQALADFSNWVGRNNKYTKVWANSPDFDVTILREAYKRCGMEFPFNFWNVRCCRTIYDLGGVRLKDFPNEIQHHAVYDCYSQIKALKCAYVNLGL